MAEDKFKVEKDGDWGKLYWTQEQLEDIAQRVLAGETMYNIAQLYEVSDKAIKRQLVKMGLGHIVKKKPKQPKPEPKYRKLNRKKAERIRTLAARGYTTAQLSKKFNVGYRAIQRIKIYQTWE